MTGNGDRSSRDRVLSELREADKLVVVAHENPDGDAIGKDLKDPRIGFVTVTGVKTSPDLRHARVYVSVLGADAERELV